MKKIYYLCYDTPGVMNDWQDFNFINELKNKGIFITKRMISIFSSPSQVLEFISKDLKKTKYDLFMTACDDRSFSDSFFNLLNEVSIPSLLFCCDNLSIPFIHKKFCSHFTLVWLTSYETQYLFDKWGAKSMYLPYAANPILYKPVKGKEINGVSFVGSIYGVRLSKLALISNSDIPINIFGKGVDKNSQSLPIDYLLNNIIEAVQKISSLVRFKIGREALKGSLKKTLQGIFKTYNSMPSVEIKKKMISFDDIPYIYSRSQISLGVTELWNTYLLKNPIHKLHLRTFEIPMSGGLQIIPKSESIKECFEEDREILLYENNDELISKIKFYTRDNNLLLRDKIKKRAYYRSLKCHTWSNRFKNILDEIGIKNEIK